MDASRPSETYRNFYELSTDLFVVVDHHGVIETVNPRWSTILGYDESELLHQPISRFMHPDDLEASIDRMHKVFEGRSVDAFLNRYLTKSGDVRWLRWRAHASRGLAYAIAQDITAERTATLKLEDANRLLSNALKLEREWRAMAEVQQERFRDLFNQVPMIAAVYSGPDHIIELANPTFYHLVNYRNVMGKSAREALPMLDETTLQVLNRVYDTGQRFVGRNFAMKADWAGTGSASEKLFHLIFEPIVDKIGHVEAIWCLAFDVSETVELEVKLRAAERMSSLGEMAAGIGHEINNPLAYSLLNLDLLTDKMGSRFGGRDEIPPPLKDLLRKSIDGLDRVRDIVKGLKAFSRQDDSIVEPVRILEPLKAAIDFTANETRHRAKVVTNLTETPRVLANAGKLAQVFTNLLVNASHALDIGKANENTITVTVSANDRFQVIVDIEDTGCGIPADKISRVFEPFYTSKPVGVGTGLGLSICHGIVASFGGDIQLTSEFGRGTRVRVVLPGTQQEQTVRDARCDHEPTGEIRKRILVIDDDKSLRDVMTAALEAEHEVTALESAVEALDHLDRTPFAYDWIICDVMMPAMTGMEFFETIRARGSGLEKKVILMTGGAFTPKVRNWMESLPNPRLEKPFRIKQLKELLQKIS